MIESRKHGLLFFVCVVMTLLVPETGCWAQDTNQQDAAEKAKPAHEHSNRLAGESSPYLLQHAHNPVDWFPWGEEAVQKAQRENKMIFLSVGYSACHWCHVMERESFEDPEIAKAMNEKFVCIKVDREERPDVDQIYMTAVQMISGGGGWPMSVFLLPDTKPFWGGTYFPARTGDRGNTTGFLTIITEIDRAWQKQPNVVRKQADQVTVAIKDSHKPVLLNPGEAPETKIALKVAMVERVASALQSQFDPVYGGFNYSAVNPNQPKFPEPANLIFLLDRMNRHSVDETRRAAAKDMLQKSLDAMISGAMVDHLGGGFHRYSVDREWQIPHFEKMLYDNGQLASVYAQAATEFNSEEYRRVTIGICDFVMRELTADGSAFYSALDADSEGEEGKFYRWTSEEISKAGEQIDGFDTFVEVYRMNEKPNFEGEFFAPAPRASLTAVAKKRGETFAQLDDRLKPIRKKLFDQRSVRERPKTDIKILTAWNGLMIAGLADAGRLLKKPEYVNAASSAADFVAENLMDESGRLKRTYAGSKATLNAYLDDYAFFARGLIALYQATDDQRWLELAKKVTDKQIELFWDEANGGFYFTSSDHPALIVRVKDPVDGAIPAGISVAAENLLFLSKHYDGSSYKQRLQQTLGAQMPMFRRGPAGVPRIAAVLAEYLDWEKP